MKLLADGEGLIVGHIILIYMVEFQSILMWTLLITHAMIGDRDIYIHLDQDTTLEVQQRRNLATPLIMIQFLILVEDSHCSRIFQKLCNLHY